MLQYKGDRVGQQVGPYRLTRLLGAGGFGEVYEADHQLLQQKRAIKLLLERHFHDPNQRERFLREARTLATLEHPNILPVLEVGEEGNMLYLVMPFYQQGTLNDLLKQRTTPLPLAEIERALAQMCAAVGYAHARHIAHLDLKPDNMLLHEDGRLVLSDFGLAHLIKQGRLEAGSSASWGTPYYMAPEQIRGEPELRSDLYALGIILFQLLTTQRPFTGNAQEAVMMKHLLEAPPPLRAVSPAVPAALEPVIQKALGKQPEDRYATTEALLADFRAALSSLSPRPAQPLAPGVPPAAPTPQMNGPAPAGQPTIIVPPERVPYPAKPATITKTTGAGCEIELMDGRSCGIQAVGRCATCGRAFCHSHQAWSGQTYYIDQCAPCFAKTPGEMFRVELAKHKVEEATAKTYFTLGAARTDLLTARVQPVEIYRVIQLWETTRKGILRRYHYDTVKKVTFSGCGWILGEFKWTYTVSSSPSRRVPEKAGIENWPTALLDVSPDDFRSYSYSSWNSTLVRVRPCSGGYEHSSSGYEWPDPEDPNHEDFKSDWRAAAQAVRRLIGASS